MKIKLAVFFGGQSVEHEIAVITANQAFESLDKEKYEIIPIYISKSGVMYTGESLFDLSKYRDMDKLLKECIQVAIVNDGDVKRIIRYPIKKLGNNEINTIDVAMPIMHGTHGEDGTIQGFLELNGIPYVGCDILSSSIGMDKIAMKKVLKESGLPVVNYYSFYSQEYLNDEDKIIKEVNDKLTYPLIVKPGNLGSSVGIKKVKDAKDLQEAIDFATQFTDRIIIENAVTDLKEINCSVIGDMIEARPSVCEEPVFSDDILSYTDKYVGGGKDKMNLNSGTKQGMAVSDKKLPADISDDMRREIEDLAVKTFKVLGCNGVSRVDFLVDKKTDKVYVNEINTIPGALSFYLWEATGTKFKDELNEIIDLALKRKRYRDTLTFSYDQNILALSKDSFGTKGVKGTKGKKI